MSAIEKSKKKDKIVVNPNMRDYSKDPYFEKKDQEALEFIKKHGLPESYTKRNKPR